MGKIGIIRAMKKIAFEIIFAVVIIAVLGMATFVLKTSGVIDEIVTLATETEREHIVAQGTQAPYIEDEEDVMESEEDEEEPVLVEPEDPPEEVAETAIPEIEPIEDAPGSIVSEVAPAPSEAEAVFVPPPLPEPRDINLRSIGALICEFENAAGETSLIRGSGAIVSANGYMLTNRHVVDQEFTAQYFGGEAGYTLKNNECKVYVIEAGISRTVSWSPKSQYAFYDIPSNATNFDFMVEVVYVPSEEDGLSDDEIQSLDFALMKLKSWNTSRYPKKKPTLYAAPVLGTYIQNEEEGIVIPGFAYQATGIGSFNTLRMLPKRGTTTGYILGDDKFAGAPVDLAIRYIPDVYGGRSGSPIFWKGYITGILKTRWIPGLSGEKLHAPQVAIQPVLELLEENGLIDVIEERY